MYTVIRIERFEDWIVNELPSKTFESEAKAIEAMVSIIEETFGEGGNRCAGMDTYLEENGYWSEPEQYSDCSMGSLVALEFDDHRLLDVWFGYDPHSGSLKDPVVSFEPPSDDLLS